MPTALAVTYGGGHVTMVIPVVTELRKRPDWEVRVLGLTMAAPALEAAGIAALGFRDLVTAGDADAVAKGAELAAQHHREGSGISREESNAYLGLSYADLESRVGIEEASRSFRELGRHAFLPLGPLERLLDRIRPDVVIATDSLRAEQAAICVARRRGIPSVCMVSLFGLDWDSVCLRQADYADRVTVMSTWVRDYLVSLGRRPGDVVVTGNPAFDRLGRPGLADRGASFRAERGWDGRKVVLWASQPQPAEELPPKILETLLRLVESHSDWHLVYRPHPNEPALALPPHARVSRSGREEDLGVLLHAVDVAVVMTTTVGIEAALVGRPLVKICLSPFDRYAPYERMQLALPVHRLEDLESRLAAALSDSPESRRLAEGRTRFPPPGGAAVRVADVIESLAS